MLPILSLLLFLGIIILFALQNLSPVVLTFLGIKSLAFPLGVWILFAIAFGFLSSLVIGVLFQISNYLSEQQLRSRIRELETEKPSSRWQRRETTTATETTSNSEYDDRQQTKAPDLDFESDRDYSPNTNTNYERSQEPTTTYRSGSVYSYGYRDPKNSGVGRTESIYDAEYRVITPPYKGVEPTEEPEPAWDSSQNMNSKDGNEIDDEDDWGFDDEDDFDDDRNRSR